MARCTEGHETRCAESKGDRCDCRCGGTNHGIAHLQMSFDEVVQDVADRCGEPVLTLDGTVLALPSAGDRS